jgi:hypothetical protein
MGNLKQDITDAADQIARALRSSNYRANFSPESLWDIDLFFDDHCVDGQPKPKGLLSDQLGQRLFAIGGYVGETIRRNRGGEWHANDADPQGEINIELKLPDGGRVWPVQRVMKRLKNGAEDGIAVYGLALGLPVGARPDPFSAFRGQASGTTPIVSEDVAAVARKYEIEQAVKSSRLNKIIGGVLLFVGSAITYSSLALGIAQSMNPRFRIPPTLFLAIIFGSYWGGMKLCSSWRFVIGCIWLCFCPLAAFNSFYFLHLQKNPLMQGNGSRLQLLSVMARASQIMIAVALLIGVVMLILHGSKRRAESQDD